MSTNTNTQTNLRYLKSLIEKAYKTAQKNDSSISTKNISETKRQRMQNNVNIASLSGIRAINGKIKVKQYEDATFQKQHLISAKAKCNALTQSIITTLNSTDLNKIQQATNDFCDLEAIVSVIPQMEERVKDLDLYERYIGNFSSTVTDVKTRRAFGILGLLGKKEKYTENRQCTPEEMQSKMKQALEELNKALAEGKITKPEYDKVIESIGRLYEDHVQEGKVEQVSREEILKEKQESDSMHNVLDNLIVKKVAKSATKKIVKKATKEVAKDVITGSLGIPPIPTTDTPEL